MFTVLSNQLTRRLPQLLTTIRNGCLKDIQNKNYCSKTINNSSVDKLIPNNGFDNRKDRLFSKDMIEFKNMSSQEKSCPQTSDLIQKVYSVIEIFEKLSNTTQLDISHYNCLLKVFLQNEYNFNPKEFLNKMKAKDIEPNYETFEALIHRFCQLSDISSAKQLLEDMKTKDLTIDESVYNSLIMGYGRAGDLKEALNCIKMSGLELNAHTFCALLCDLKNSESFEKINELINSLDINEIVLNDNQLLQIIKTVAVVDRESQIINILMNKLNKTIGYNEKCMKTITELIQLNELKIAFKLYETLKQNDIHFQQKSNENQLTELPNERLINLNCNHLRARKRPKYKYIHSYDAIDHCLLTVLIIGFIYSALPLIFYNI